jgi:hypothetical protein
MVELPEFKFANSRHLRQQQKEQQATVRQQDAADDGCKFTCRWSATYLVIIDRRQASS